MLLFYSSPPGCWMCSTFCHHTSAVRDTLCCYPNPMFAVHYCLCKLLLLLLLPSLPITLLLIRTSGSFFRFFSRACTICLLPWDERVIFPSRIPNSINLLLRLCNRAILLMPSFPRTNNHTRVLHAAVHVHRIGPHLKAQSHLTTTSHANRRSSMMHSLRKLGASLLSNSSSPTPPHSSASVACNFYSYPPTHTSRLSLASVNPYSVATETHRFGSDGCLLSTRRQPRSLSRHASHQPSSYVSKVLGLRTVGPPRSDAHSNPPSPVGMTFGSSLELSDNTGPYPTDVRRPSQLTRLKMPVKRYSAAEPGIPLTHFSTTPAARASGLDNLSSVLSPLLSNLLTNRVRKASAPEVSVI